MNKEDTMSRSMWSKSALLAVLALGWMGCGGAQGKLEEQRKAWEAVRPARYAYDYRGTGWSPLRGTWRIGVQGEEVMALTSPEGGGGSDGLTVETADTIDDLFDQVAGSLGQSDVDVEVVYDPQWHFPTDVYFDWGEEGIGFIADNFTPLD
jgi:hypothetical protein